VHSHSISNALDTLCLIASKEKCMMMTWANLYSLHGKYSPHLFFKWTYRPMSGNAILFCSNNDTGCRNRDTKRVSIM